ncbi:WD40-repeat-containing domain protein [Lentinula raphanica]|nr:WD40-repeat-containing domain protein [Lentinula raphanica]
MLDPSYNVLGTIEAPNGAVNALAFSDDGRYLASASDDMIVRVHDLKRRLSTIWMHHGKSPFTTVVWFKEHLVAGNGDGEVMMFWHPTAYWLRRHKQQIIAEFYTPIHFLEFNCSGDQLLVCSGSRTSLLTERKPGHWKLRCHFDPPSSFEEAVEFGEPDGFEEPQVLATSAHFLHEKDCVVIGYLHHGLWYALFHTLLWSWSTENAHRKHKIETGTNVLVWGPDEKIGSTALSPDGTALVIANIRSGIDWVKVYAGFFTRWKRISASWEIQDPSGNIPLPVQFIDKGRYVLMGTSKGYAVLFHARHGKRVISLDHGSDKTWITALAYIHPKNRPQLIATGDGNCGTNSKIKVWVEDLEENHAVTTSSNVLNSSVMRYVYSITNIIRNISTVIGISAMIFLLLPPMWREAIEIPYVTAKPFSALFFPRAFVTQVQHPSKPSQDREVARHTFHYSSEPSVTQDPLFSEPSDIVIQHPFSYSFEPSEAVTQHPFLYSSEPSEGVNQHSFSYSSQSEPSEAVIQHLFPPLLEPSIGTEYPLVHSSEPPVVTRHMFLHSSVPSVVTQYPYPYPSIRTLDAQSELSQSTTVVPVSTTITSPDATTIFVTLPPVTHVSSVTTDGRGIWDKIFGV